MVKTDMVQVFKSIFPFVEWTFKNIAEKLNFSCNSAENWENLNS